MHKCSLAICLLMSLLLPACGGSSGGTQNSGGAQAVIHVVNDPLSDCMITVVFISNEAGAGFFDDIPLSLSPGESADLTVAPGTWDVGVLHTIPEPCFHDPIVRSDLVAPPGGVVEARLRVTSP